METKKKKKYAKLKVTKIKLDAKCAVLGGCKIGGDEGPFSTGCSPPLGCNSLSS